MENLREEVSVLKSEKKELDKKVEKELKELEELREKTQEMKIRKILLEELLGIY